MSPFVLRDENVDPPTYFAAWTGIGPMGTWKLEEAARFETKEAALRSPAARFWLTAYTPVEIPAASPEPGAAE